MKCVLVDDDELSRVSLEFLCSKIEDLEVVASVDNAMDALSIINDQNIELLLLDIEMPSLSGLDLVKSVENLPNIIFISAKAEYAADAFEYKELVIDYLTKPVDLPRFLKAINKVKESISGTASFDITKDYMFIKSDGRLVRIDFDDLYYLETVGDYVRFKTSKNSYLIHSSLKKLDAKFQHDNFIKVHRSFIVNISKIENIEENSILVNGKVIPISRAHKNQVMEKINPF